MDTLLKEKALTICAVIKATNTDDRGLLLLEIADQLTLDAQGFTAELFRIIGTRYGTPSKGSNMKLTRLAVGQSGGAKRNES